MGLIAMISFESSRVLQSTSGRKACDSACFCDNGGPAAATALIKLPAFRDLSSNEGTPMATIVIAEPHELDVTFHVQGLVGRSPAMQDVFDRIRRFADSLAPVYISGETGTGKEQVARALHARSPRSAAPFVALNAAGLTDELFESELFGHVRGAFTGAVNDRVGLVAAAEGGTLFIDEVADLSPRGQVKLLRFLEEKKYRRVGDPREREANVRIVSAANCDLGMRVLAGQFRQDLLYRLNVLTVELPALRCRAGDVPLLARHLLRRVAHAEGRPVPRLSEAAARVLEGYPWPGNVRELHAEMQRALLNGSDPVRPEDLSPHLARPAAAGGDTLAAALRQFERDYVRRTLAQCGGRRGQAAQRLGVTRQGLGLKIKRLGLLEELARTRERACGAA
jgi:DNA-binding NtrC family response regulator